MSLQFVRTIVIGSPVQKDSFCFQDGKAHRIEGCVGCTFDLDIYGRVACSKMARRQRPNQPSVESNLLRLLKVEPMENDIVNNRNRNGFATILQIWDSFEPIGIGPTSYINFVEGVGLIVLCKVWTENYLLPFGKNTEQFTDLDFGSILNPSYLAWTNVSCIHSGQREAFGFLFGERKTQL
jgi:hypothetical protein